MNLINLTKFFYVFLIIALFLLHFLYGYDSSYVDLIIVTLLSFNTVLNHHIIKRLDSNPQ